jgi:hypothetical protein
MLPSELVAVLDPDKVHVNGPFDTELEAVTETANGEMHNKTNVAKIMTRISDFKLISDLCTNY